MRLFISSLVFLLTLTSLASERIDSKLPIQELIQDSQAFWGLSVRDLATQEVLSELNSHKLFTPASNLKLLTSAAVLNTLGPDFIYQTKIYGRGFLDESTWYGDLYLVGAGDPSMDGKFTDGNRFAAFENLSKQLKALGIKKIEGNLIGNDAYFDQETAPKNWAWSDLFYYYAPELSALSFNGNCINLTIEHRHGTTSLEWFPFNTDYVKLIDLQTKANKFREAYKRMPGTNLIVLNNQLPGNFTEHETLTITLPSLYAIDTFKKYLQTQNVQLTGELLLDHEKRDWNKLTLLATHQSVALKELLKEVNKESNNFYTEMLLKTAAAKKYKVQGSTEAGLQLVKDFASQNGFNAANLFLADGSGLSPQNLISPSHMTLFLSKMTGHKYFTSWENSLSVAGIDGSLENRFAKSILKNKLKGKSGFITGARTLSGYLETKNGRLLSFSLAANHYTASNSQIDRKQIKILETIYHNF